MEKHLDMEVKGNGDGHQHRRTPRIPEPSGEDLATSLGDGKKFRGPRFLNDVFSGKNFHFHGKNF